MGSSPVRVTKTKARLFDSVLFYCPFIRLDIPISSLCESVEFSPLRLSFEKGPFIAFFAILCDIFLIYSEKSDILMLYIYQILQLILTDTP